MIEELKIPRWKALPLMSSDALSSTAYATEEILIALMTFSLLALSWSMPVAIAIVILLAIVTISFRQTIEVYPGGGSAYVVAKENLGHGAGLLTGAALLIDYVLTVAVSVAAGMANIDSALPAIQGHRELICAVVIIAIMMLNLRGNRESGVMLALPSYFFIGSFLLLLGAGSYNLLTGKTLPAAPLLHETYPEIPLFLLLRSFSSGCAALAGVESIADGVTRFKEPRIRNAKSTLFWMTAILAVFFIGLTVLAHVLGITPKPNETVISQLARAVFGKTGLYYLFQGLTALILFTAANTAYQGFPRLCSMLARDRYLPRQLASVGDRLVFSNGIVGLSLLAIFLIIFFEGDVHRLIPLYAIGVFLSFTLSQTGMVLHHWRERGTRWIRSLSIHGAGAVTTLTVLLVIASTKFTHGAWMVIAAMPPLFYLFTRIHHHYLAVGAELSLERESPPNRLPKVKHTVIVPISGIHRGVIEALRYAVSISDDVRACYVEIDPSATERIQSEWMKWAHEIPFVILKSPYRSVLRPMLEYIDDVAQSKNEEIITIVIPEFVTSKWRYSLLHNQTALLIRTALLFKRNRVVTSVRYHLKS
ncbi:MAG: APC family permease [Bdellovibrionales bacterium]|nr:APC family permease [Bdellovibrionales bacterium]